MAITTTRTYIKFDSAPSSASDYDYCSQSSSGYLKDSSGNTLTQPFAFSNKTCVYVWGYTSGPTGILGQVTINNTLHLGGKSYDTAVCYQLTENSEISLGCGSSSGGPIN